MIVDQKEQMPEDILFHCRKCNAARSSHADDLRRCIAEDAHWPRCCGVRMAVSFPHGHPELIISP